MKLVLGREVGLGLGDFMLDGDPAPSPKRGRSPLPNFCPLLLCQTAGWINMTLGMELGLGTGDFVLDGEPVPHPR